MAAGAKVQSQLVYIVTGAKLPGTTRLQAKVDMPKAFSGAKQDAAKIDSWVFSMNLYFAALNLLGHMHAVHAALNLVDKAVVWLHAQDIDLVTTMWVALAERLCRAFCPADWK